MQVPPAARLDPVPALLRGPPACELKLIVLAVSIAAAAGVSFSLIWIRQLFPGIPSKPKAQPRPKWARITGRTGALSRGYRSQQFSLRGNCTSCTTGMIFHGG